MFVKYNELRPAGFVVQLKLANGWTFSVRQTWENTVEVSAFRTDDAESSRHGYAFGTRGHYLRELGDSEVAALLVEVVSLPPTNELETEYLGIDP